MKVIIVFWTNAENFMGVVEYTGESRMDEQVRGFEKLKGFDVGSCFGQVEEVCQVSEEGGQPK